MFRKLKIEQLLPHIATDNLWRQNSIFLNILPNFRLIKLKTLKESISLQLPCIPWKICMTFTSNRKR